MRTVAEKGSPLAAARIRAHQAFDYHWQYQGMTRSECYARLAEAMQMPKSDCHIGMFNESQCEEVIRICARWGNS